MFASLKNLVGARLVDRASSSSWIHSPAITFLRSDYSTSSPLQLRHSITIPGPTMVLTPMKFVEIHSLRTLSVLSSILSVLSLMLASSKNLVGARLVDRASSSSRIHSPAVTPPNHPRHMVDQPANNKQEHDRSTVQHQGLEMNEPTGQPTIKQEHD
ncbi:hypothetical protein F2Q70_00021599 [Brassica cretica]|uniref:Uncharacterized protein n=1 Tax=Brassica cretica TaxID=69181 RepID=A0A8S9GL75_BRACR|nr:hypothetical protein F2Q70_00021599 [Brassica cretica]KAF2556767.1 hypothetical protein F2Q68_00015217 [Brassica cretica]